jgi:hypothetical protein
MAFSESSQAQFKFPSLFKKSDNNRRRQFEPFSIVSFGGGTSHYFGDLAPYGRPFNSAIDGLSWNIGATYTRRFAPNWGLRFGLTWIRIKGDDANFANVSQGSVYLRNFVRGLHFRNDIKELSTVLTFDFVPVTRNFERRGFMSPYLFAGINVFAHDPMALDQPGGRWVRLQPLGTEGQGQPGQASPYSLIQVSVPLGLGFRFKLSKRLDLTVEGSFRYTFTKYLDDVGGDYPNQSLLTSNDARQFSNRSLEAIAAYAGLGRDGGVRRYIIENLQQPLDPSEDPFQALQQSGYGQAGDFRASNKYNDAYAVTAFHLNYYIPGKIKCPPLR